MGSKTTGLDPAVDCFSHTCKHTCVKQRFIATYWNCYFPATFYHEPGMLRPEPRISRWRVIGIKLLDIRYLPIDVWQQFSNLIELWSCTAESPHCHPLLLLQQDPWIISFWSHKGMNKSFIAPFAPTEIPSVQLNISEWKNHSPKVIYNEATQSEIDGWDFQLCAWEMFPAICSNVFFFSSLPPDTYVSQRGVGGGANGELHSPFIPPFYVQF